MEDNKKRIKEILSSFNVRIESIEEKVGHSITLYEVKPSLGVRISKIRNLKDEIAIGLSVPAVRIVAPLPSGLVGIEVPNKTRQVIPISDIIESEEYIDSKAELPCAIGRTIANEVFVPDLADMPHMLIAGATGQGKSVCLNTILLSLLESNSPEEMKLVLVDPKQVEMSAYASLRDTYLAAPVLTEADKAYAILCDVVTEMERRYSILNENGVRNLGEYNIRYPDSQMPYIVVVIDEYGDLVMSAGREFEKIICRIAQKARAVGIHMIISTQRPSATIVTGDIKANFPTRMAFRTVTGVDSRVILDQTGAEKLTGKGDFIYYSGAELLRGQCALTTIDDIKDLVAHIHEQYADYVNTPTLQWEIREEYRRTHPSLLLQIAQYIADFDYITMDMIEKKFGLRSSFSLENTLELSRVIACKRYDYDNWKTEDGHVVLVHDKSLLPEMVAPYENFLVG